MNAHTIETILARAFEEMPIILTQMEHRSGMLDRPQPYPQLALDFRMPCAYSCFR